MPTASVSLRRPQFDGRFTLSLLNIFLKIGYLLRVNRDKTRVATVSPRVAGTGGLRPVTAMMKTITKAKPTKDEGLEVFGNEACGFGALSLIICSMGELDPRVQLPFRLNDAHFSNHQVPAIDDFRNDIDSALQIEVHEIGLPLLYLINRGLSLAADDAGKTVIVVNGRDQTGAPCAFLARL